MDQKKGSKKGKTQKRIQFLCDLEFVRAAVAKLEEDEEGGVVEQEFHRTDIAEAVLHPTGPAIKSDIERTVSLSEEMARARRLLAGLTPEENQVTFLLFGLDGGGDRTEKEVAKILKKTPEEVLGIWGAALSKMKTAASN